MRHRIPALLVSLALGSSALQAQTPQWVSDLLIATQLPVQTMEARREGVANDDIRAVLDAMRRNRIPAHEATVVIDTARSVRREHGPVDNFGAFVQAQLASGKRGRELAAAIRAEHARQGKGNAARDARARGQGGRADDAPDTARGRGKARPGQPPDTGRKSDNPGRGRGRPNP